MNTILHSLIDPWRWDLSLSVYWPIIVQGILVSISLGLVGCFLVVRGLSLLGDALSHSVLPGIVVGFLVSAALGSASLHSPWILIGATTFGLIASALIESVHRASRVKEDAAMGIVLTTLFALGVVLINLFGGGADLDPGCVLYGNIENYVLDRSGMKPMALILLGIIVGITLFYRHLLICSFDPALATAIGIPALLVHYALMGTLSLTIVASFEAVGAILSVALLILPGATARLWCDRMHHMLFIAALHGTLSSVIGYAISHEAMLNTSAGGSICVAGFGLFLISWLVAPRQGLIVQFAVRKKLEARIRMENLLRAVDEMTAGASGVRPDAVREQLGFTQRGFKRATSIASELQLVSVNLEAIQLTQLGKAVADRLSRAHVLWEEYLQSQVGLPADHVHDAAEWIEHFLDEDRIAELDAALQTGRGAA